jgi:hypothetical protein
MDQFGYRIYKNGTIIMSGLSPAAVQRWFEAKEERTATASVERFDYLSQQWVHAPFYWGINGFTWGTYGA